ncbi:MAG: hypothetical protein GY754_46760 [bacterium]|nr:hypothetical protein [bacterium]
MNQLVVLVAMCAILVGAGLVLIRVYKANPEFTIKILNYALLTGLVIVLSGVSVALGIRTKERGRQKFHENLTEVKQIWGNNIVQRPPAISYKTLTRVERQNWKTGEPYKVNRIVSKDIKIKKSSMDISIDKDIRKKGLQVYNGYILKFKGTYVVKNPLGKDEKIYFHLPLPSGGNNITNATISVNGKQYDRDQKVSDGLDWKGTIKSGRNITIIISYACQGLDSFRYALDYVEREIPEFSMTINTDFDSDDINYIRNSMVHTGISESDGRSIVLWKAKNLITRQPVAISFDSGKRTDEIVAGLYMYSPLAIFLFLAILLVFSIAYDIRLHFMHFVFFGAGFLFFYFFLSYIVSYIGFIPGFILSAMLSGSMLIYYSKILNRGRKLMEGTVIGLVMFQFFFSFAFYFPMHTGFLILIGSAATLFLLMRATAGIDWQGKF